MNENFSPFIQCVVTIYHPSSKQTVTGCRHNRRKSGIRPRRHPRRHCRPGCHLRTRHIDIRGKCICDSKPRGCSNRCRPLTVTDEPPRIKIIGDRETLSPPTIAPIADGSTNSHVNSIILLRSWTAHATKHYARPSQCPLAVKIRGVSKSKRTGKPRYFVTLERPFPVRFIANSSGRVVAMVDDRGRHLSFNFHSSIHRDCSDRSRNHERIGPRDCLDTDGPLQSSMIHQPSINESIPTYGKKPISLQT